MLNDIIYRACIRSGVPASKEPTGLFLNDEKITDGMTLVPWKKGRCVTWDVTCPDTLAASHRQITAYGRPPLHGQIIQQVIQQVIQQIIQLFRNFWVGVTDCCMTFRDQNPISTTSEHVQMLQRLRTCCMSLIDKSVRWRRVTANHTAIIQLLTLSRYYYVIYYVIA